MSLINRVENGTTTTEDVEAVRNLMEKSSTMSLLAFAIKKGIVFLILGALLLGLALGGFLF